MMKMIWIAVAAVAIPLALSVINAQAQGADDLPRIGETTTEYNLRMARTWGDREALREALREAQEKAHREAMREAQEKAEKAHRDALRESQAHRDVLRESLEVASKQSENVVKDIDRTIKDQNARAERAREARCNRLSQRASEFKHGGPRNRPNERFVDECM
jgi:Xaa-Pro aminopeptidase